MYSPLLTQHHAVLVTRPSPLVLATAGRFLSDRIEVDAFHVEAVTYFSYRTSGEADKRHGLLLEYLVTHGKHMRGREHH